MNQSFTKKCRREWLYPQPKFSNRRPRDTGFILLMTLLILAVISLLVLNSMHHVLLYYKAINKQEVFHDRFYQLEHIALQLVQQNKSLNPDCILHSDSANQVVQDLQNRKGCILVNGFSQYQYILEELGEFPCLVVHLRGKKLATRHQRVTVVSMGNNIPISVIQMRVIHSARAIPCLRKKEHSVPLGISSWRYISYLSM